MFTRMESTESTSGERSRTAILVLVGLMSAVICILGPLSIPIGPVPISLTNLALYFIVYVLGMKYTTISYGIYLLLGLAGLPVFSAYTSGPAKLLGPTGGYLIGFIFLALISGFFVEQWPSKKGFCFLGMALGTIVCYVFGTGWLAYEAGMSFSAALSVGVLPFIPGDLIKIVLAVIVGPQIRSRLVAAGLV